MEVMGSRLLSPNAYPAPRWGRQPEGPGSVQRHGIEEPVGSESGTALTSVVVQAPDCALQLLLDDVYLVPEPEQTWVLQVSLGMVGGHTLMLEPGALLDAPREDVAILQGFFCACVSEIAIQEEDYDEDSDPEFLPP